MGTKRVDIVTVFIRYPNGETVRIDDAFVERLDMVEQYAMGPTILEETLPKKHPVAVMKREIRFECTGSDIQFGAK